jgi:pantothenate kinase
MTSFADLVDRARALVDDGRRAVLGITGAPAAGKTTLAGKLVKAIGSPWAAHVPMDGFHLADVELDRLGRRDRKGAPDTFDALGYAAWATGTDERNAAVILAPRDRADPIVPAALMRRIGAPPA